MRPGRRDVQARSTTFLPCRRDISAPSTGHIRPVDGGSASGRWQRPVDRLPALADQQLVRPAERSRPEEPAGGGQRRRVCDLR